MAGREAEDVRQSELYAGRWVVGKDLIFPNRLGATVTDSGFEFSEQTASFLMHVKINTDPSKQSAEARYGIDAARMNVEPVAVYLDIGTAERLQKKLEELKELYPSTIGQVGLYDADESESLLAVYALINGPQKEMVGIKRKIRGAVEPDAKLLTYELNIDGEWTSID